MRKVDTEMKVIEGAGPILTWGVQVNGEAVFGDHLQVVVLR